MVVVEVGFEAEFEVVKPKLRIHPPPETRRAHSLALESRMWFVKNIHPMDQTVEGMPDVKNLDDAIRWAE